MGMEILGRKPRLMLIVSTIQVALLSSHFTMEVAGQSPQMLASVGSYPPPEAIEGVTELVAGQESEDLSANQKLVFPYPVSVPAQFPPNVGGDYYEAVPANEITAVEDVPFDLSSDEAIQLLGEECEFIDGREVCLPPSITGYMLEPYRHYREHESNITYIPGDGDQFGWLTFGSNTWLKRGASSGIDANFNLHLLSGPEIVALPPRLYDFELGYQSKASLSEKFSYDIGVSVGVYSDFEDSARDGVRFPAHLVGMFHPTENWDWVFGIEYLDRDDIKLLPVIGFVWHDTSLPGLRIEAVFPRPRVDLQFQKDMRLYWTARLGGGSWDIEMPDDSNDVFTYRDYQILMGIEGLSSDKCLHAWEFGFAFSRHIEFRNRVDEATLDEAFVLRHVTRY